MAESDAVWIDVLPSMKGFFPAMSKEAAASSQKAGILAGTLFGQGFKAMSGKLKGVMAGAIGGFSVAAVTKSVWSLGKEFEAVQNNMVKQTGATGKSLEGLMDTVKAIGAGGTVDSFDKIGQAVAGVSQRLNLTGEPLKTVSKQMLSLSRIGKVDLNTTITDSTRMFGDWSIKTGDQSKALDQLYKASTVSGVGVDKLAESVTQYGAPLRQLGFSYQQALAMTAKWNKEGVNSTLVMGGMRKALATMAKAGKDPKKEFPALIKQIQGMSSASKAGQLAAQYFGTKAGPDMAAAIREGRFSIDDMTKTITDSDGALAKSGKNTGTLSGKWTILSNQMKTVAEPAAKGLLDTLTDLGAQASSKLTPEIERLNQGWKDGTGPIGELRDATRDLKADWASGSGDAGELKDALIGLGGALKDGAAFALRYRDALKNMVEVLGSVYLGVKAARIMEASYQAGQRAGIVVARGYIAVKKVLNGTISAAKWIAEKTAMVAHKVAMAASTVATKAHAAAMKSRNAAIAAGGWVADQAKMVAHKVATAAHTVAEKASSAAVRARNTAIAAGGWVADQAKMVAHKVATAASTVAQKAATAAIKAKNLAIKGAGWAKDTALMLAHKAASMAVTVAQKAMAVAQRLVNAAMRANPIGIVITLLMLLAAGFVYAWKHSETFRRIVTGAWNGIKWAAQAVWGWLKPNVIDKMVLFFGTVLPAAFRTFGRIFGSIWNGIKAAAAKPANFVIGTVWNNGLRKALNLIPGVNLKEAKKVPGYRHGGYTGDGADDEVAGPAHRGEFYFSAPEVRSLGGRTGMERIRAGLAAGRWPVGAAGEVGETNQNTRYQGSLPSSLTSALPTDLRRVIAHGPGRDAQGFGGAAGESAARWGLGRIGSAGWYRRCLAFVNQAWGRRIAGLNKATARISMNSVPRRMDGNPPAGSAVYWDTGGAAGHVALAVGDGTELSNDIMSPGIISRVAHETFAKKWGAKYMGWYSPDGSQPGANSSWLSKIKGFIGKAAAGAGDLFSGLLSSITGKMKSIKDAALKGLTSPWGKLLSGIPGWAIGKATAWVKSKIGSLMSSSDPVGSGVERWRSTIAQALAYTKIGSGTGDENLWLKQVQTESSGNPNLVQSSSVYDVNIARGDPARGLLQIPKVTWADYGGGMGPFIPNVYNPLKNSIVAMRDAGSVYHNWRRVIGKGHGYQHGTGSADPGLSFLSENGMVELITSPQARVMHGGERVYNSAQTRRILGGTSGGDQAAVFNLYDSDGVFEGKIYGTAQGNFEDNMDRLARIGA